MLTTMIFALGLLADFLLLPPILLFLENLKKSEKKDLVSMQKKTV